VPDGEKLPDRRMREIRTSGGTRGEGRIIPPLLYRLCVKLFFLYLSVLRVSVVHIFLFRGNKILPFLHNISSIRT